MMVLYNVNTLIEVWKYDVDILIVFVDFRLNILELKSIHALTSIYY